MAAVRVIHGDSAVVIRGLPDDSVDAVVTDPPYALVSIVKRFGKPGATSAKSNGASGVYARASAGFMGQQWDTGAVAFSPEFWAEVLRVLKPGGHVLAFSATRTYHRLACAIEDAGFEIRDMVAWLYGQGFPKSHNLCTCNPHQESGRIDQWGWRLCAACGRPWELGTALKPGHEPICMARKPLIGGVEETVAAYGLGAVNIEGCRVVWPDGIPLATVPNQDAVTVDRSEPSQLGRWPANVVHDSSTEVISAFPAAPGQQGRVSGGEPTSNGFSGAVKYSGMLGRKASAPPRQDSGSAARFFYTAKASREDRMGSKHPTVKPVALMRWLCRMVTPPGGIVLDPFAGSGTTGAAALREGFGAILIEREEPFVADILRRLDRVGGDISFSMGGVA